MNYAAVELCETDEYPGKFVKNLNNNIKELFKP